MSIEFVKKFIDDWERYGELSLLAHTDPMTDERRKILFHEEKYVFLFPSRGMFKVRLEVIDLSYKSIGMIDTYPHEDALDYNRALDFFLYQMGLYGEEMVKARVTPIINSNDAIWVKIPFFFIGTDIGVAVG